MMIRISVKVITYGVPALLIILGWLTLVLGGDLLSSVSNLAGYGWDMIAMGVLIYILEILLKIFGVHA